MKQERRKDTEEGRSREVAEGMKQLWRRLKWLFDSAMLFLEPVLNLRPS